MLCKLAFAGDNSALLEEVNTGFENFAQESQYNQLERARKTVKFLCGDEMECLKNNNSQQLTENNTTESKQKNASRNIGNNTNSRKKVKRVYWGGYKTSQGYKIQIIQCEQGNSYTAFKKLDNFWYDGSGFNYGENFKGLSLSDFAVKKCE